MFNVALPVNVEEAAVSSTFVVVAAVVVAAATTAIVAGRPARSADSKTDVSGNKEDDES